MGYEHEVVYLRTCLACKNYGRHWPGHFPACFSENDGCHTARKAYVTFLVFERCSSESLWGSVSCGAIHAPRSRTDEALCAGSKHPPHVAQTAANVRAQDKKLRGRFERFRLQLSAVRGAVAIWQTWRETFAGPIRACHSSVDSTRLLHHASRQQAREHRPLDWPRASAGAVDTGHGANGARARW